MKNPFSNLFKKKPKSDQGNPVPQAQDKKRKKDFLVNFLKIG